MMSNLAIIPARGGSKRIPRKNIKDFLGKPIIAYSIETALESGLFDEVMVSTEDEEIAEIAEKNGARIPFMRSDENASDYATTVDVLLEVIEKYKEENKTFDNVCCIYPTAPFVRVGDLEKGFQLLQNSTSSLPVIEYEFPVLRAFKIDENKNIHFAWSKYKKARSQDLETYYHDAGQWYWIKEKTLTLEKTLITSASKAVKKSHLVVQDIDTEQDWELAELKYSLIK